MIGTPEIEFRFHKRGSPDEVRSYAVMPVPRIGETVIFGQQAWRIDDVTYNLDRHRIEVLAVVH